MIELVVLLLPIAAASGWYTASRRYKAKSNAKPESQRGYFRGINYLLNEQPDKAINVFVDLLEIDNEVIETHLALGSLFRRRGEVEKAIRLHQNLIARPKLGHLVRLDVLQELGLDYMRAGLFDRAEALFLELEEHASHEEVAVTHLLEIFQQEREWSKAIEYAKKRAAIRKKQTPLLLSHLYCELAIKLRKHGDIKGADVALKKALQADPNCVRVNMLLAKFAQENQDYKQALKHYRAIEEQSPVFLDEVLDSILECFDALENQDGKYEFLLHLKNDLNMQSAMAPLLELIRQREGDDAALEFVMNSLQETANLGDTQRYLSLCQAVHQPIDAAFVIELLRQLAREEQKYQCRKCGHVSREMHWRCTRCQQWGQVEPSAVEPLNSNITSYSM